MPATLLLNVSDAEVRFGPKVLFSGLSFAIAEGERICLLGQNGAGKSTLMNVITGARELDEGERWQLQGSTTGYLQQEATFKPGQKVFDYVFESMSRESQDENHSYKIEMVLEPLALEPDADMSSLSGGQLRRAALARALVESPDILLLDEPTNHMDLEVIGWLEQQIKSYRGAVVCVSHDRAFLSAISDRVFWLDRGRLRICPKGFSYFEEWSTLLIEQEQRELHNRQKLLEQEVDWASRGVPARRKRNVRRLSLMKEERAKLRSDKNALSRMLARVDFTPEVVDEATSKSVCEFHKVSKFFDDKRILEGFNLRILRGDRIGVIGRNGSGKSSFLKMLVGEMTPDSGTVKRAKTAEIAYFDQKRKDLRLDRSLHANLCPHGSDYIDVMGKPRHVYGYLKSFLFDPQLASAPASILSGGQKNRLMLAKIMANPGNFLILDEPTNDLDMETLDMLEDMLSKYNGTLIVVSHDRDFLDQTVSKILAFEGDGKVVGAIGGYQDYLDQKKRQESGRDEEGVPVKKAAKGMPVSTAPVPKRAQKMPYKVQYELERLPTKIAKLEAEINDIESALSDAELYAKDPHHFHALSQRIGLAQRELGDSETRWLELEELKAVIEAGE